MRADAMAVGADDVALRNFCEHQRPSKATVVPDTEGLLRRIPVVEIHAARVEALGAVGAWDILDCVQHRAPLLIGTPLALCVGRQ